jgi:serine/threonine-protein kinase
MAPEQFRGFIGPQSDVYGLGATLYEMLTGRPPFQGSTDEETVRQALNEPVQPPRLANPEVDRELERLCLRCLENKPEHRYATAAEVRRDLEHYLKTGQGPRPLTFWEWFWRTMERKVHFEHGESWSRITRFWALYTAAGHAAMFGLLELGAPGWGYWLWFLVFHTLGWAPIWLILGRSRRELDSTEWGVLLNWAGAVAADGLLLALFCPLSGTPPPESVARAYPAWMAMHGLMWFMEARAYWGRFYLLGLSFFAAAALMPLAGVFAPLAFAAVNSTGLLLLSYALRQSTWMPRTRRPRGSNPESSNFTT